MEQEKSKETMHVEIETRKTTEWCKHVFNEKELREIARDLAQSMADLNRKQAALKAVSTVIKGEIAELEARTSKDANLFNTGYEMREIECEEEKDYRLGVVRLTRLDTFEMIRERAMRADERQPRLTAILRNKDDRDGKDGEKPAEVGGAQAETTDPATDPRDAKE